MRKRYFQLFQAVLFSLFQRYYAVLLKRIGLTRKFYLQPKFATNSTFQLVLALLRCFIEKNSFDEKVLFCSLNSLQTLLFSWFQRYYAVLLKIIVLNAVLLKMIVLTRKCNLQPKFARNSTFQLVLALLRCFIEKNSFDEKVLFAA